MWIVGSIRDTLLGKSWEAPFIFDRKDVLVFQIIEMKYIHWLFGLGFFIDIILLTVNTGMHPSIERIMVFSLIWVGIISIVVGTIKLIQSKKIYDGIWQKSYKKQKITQAKKWLYTGLIWVVVFLLIPFFVHNLRLSMSIERFDICTLKWQKIVSWLIKITQDTSAVDWPWSMAIINDKSYRVWDESFLKERYTDNPELDKRYWEYSKYRQIRGTWVIYYKMAWCYGGGCMMYDPNRKDACTAYFDLTAVSEFPEGIWGEVKEEIQEEAIIQEIIAPLEEDIYPLNIKNDVELIESYYKLLGEKKLKQAYTMRINSNISFEEFEWWYGDAAISEIYLGKGNVHKRDDGTYTLISHIHYNYPSWDIEHDAYSIRLKIVDNKIEILSSVKHVAVTEKVSWLFYEKINWWWPYTLTIYDEIWQQHIDLGMPIKYGKTKDGKHFYACQADWLIGDAFYVYSVSDWSTVVAQTDMGIETCWSYDLETNTFIFEARDKIYTYSFDEEKLSSQLIKQF